MELSVGMIIWTKLTQGISRGTCRWTIRIFDYILLIIFVLITKI